MTPCSEDCRWERFFLLSAKVLILGCKSNALLGSCANLDRNSAGNLDHQPVTPRRWSERGAGCPGSACSPTAQTTACQRLLAAPREEEEEAATGCAARHACRSFPELSVGRAKFQLITQALEYLQVFQFGVVARSEVAVLAKPKPPNLPVRCSLLAPVRPGTGCGGVLGGSPGGKGWCRQLVGLQGVVG